MDSDELFRHLRREHLYCHFCDADGKHQYYNSYDDLRTHFLEEHYLCEEGDCKNEQFTSVFRTEIDLKGYSLLFLSFFFVEKISKIMETDFYISVFFYGKN